VSYQKTCVKSYVNNFLQLFRIQSFAVTSRITFSLFIGKETSRDIMYIISLYSVTIINIKDICYEKFLLRSLADAVKSPRLFVLSAYTGCASFTDVNFVNSFDSKAWAAPRHNATRQRVNIYNQYNNQVFRNIVK